MDHVLAIMSALPPALVGAFTVETAENPYLAKDLMTYFLDKTDVEIMTHFDNSDTVVKELVTFVIPRIRGFSSNFDHM